MAHTQEGFVRSTWMHFIGGYYSSTDKFIREAQGPGGIARRIPAQVARGMAFGDRVVLLRYNGKNNVQAFAEMVLDSVTFEGDFASKVGKKLVEQGRAAYTPGCISVSRECGSYIIAGVFEVASDVSLSEIVQMAQSSASEGESVFVMIGGHLSKVYDTPVLLSPPPKFSRGFFHAEDGTFVYEGGEGEPPNRVIGVQDYRKASRSSKKQAQGMIPFALPT